MRLNHGVMISPPFGATGAPPQSASQRLQQEIIRLGARFMPWVWAQTVIDFSIQKRELENGQKR